LKKKTSSKIEVEEIVANRERVKGPLYFYELTVQQRERWKNN
jgi:hypothetical protein